jgi:hypothetical protein
MVTRKLVAILSGVLVGMLSIVAPILAHSGNTDSNGGHSCDVKVYGEKECAKWGAPPDYYHYHHRPVVAPTPTLFPEQPPDAESATSSNGRVDNRFYNGNFEFGFYKTPLGRSPNNWGWFMNDQAAGKYGMFDYTDLKIACSDDLDASTKGKSALALQMNSTDQPNAWLGIYQVAHVTPGVDYVFSISGTIQVAFGFKPTGDNNRVYIAFDQNGGTDWRAIPEKAWQRLPWREQDIDFTGAVTDTEQVLQIDDYFTAITAQSKKLTVFIGAHRTYPNIRSSRISLDCALLLPLNKVSPYPYADPLSDFSAVAVDVALNSETPHATAVTMMATQAKLIPMASAPTVIQAAASSHGNLPVTGQAAVAAAIPQAGGIIDGKPQALPVAILALVVIIGLFGTGWWYSREEEE